MSDLWTKLAKKAYLWALKRLSTPDGERSVGVIIPLGSGYSVEEDNQMDRDALRRACEEAVVSPDFRQRDITGDGEPETFCNRGTRWIAERVGCHFFRDSQSANMMVSAVECSPEWRKDSSERAMAHADKGGLAVACRKKPGGHGHISVVYPSSDGYFSGSLGKKVPLLAHIGVAPNGIKGASKCFSVAEGEPEYYLWTAGA